MARKGPAPNPDTDWEGILREYRAGILSLREIARMFGVSPALICKRAKKHPKQWKRDLSKRVRVAIARKIVSSAVNDDTVNAGSEDDIVEAAANRALVIIKQHRKAIVKLDETKAKLLKELHNNPTKLWIGQHQGQILTKKVAIAVTEKSTALLALAGVEERRIKLERQAFGMTDETKPEQSEQVVHLICPLPGVGGS